MLSPCRIRSAGSKPMPLAQLMSFLSQSVLQSAVHKSPGAPPHANDDANSNARTGMVKECSWGDDGLDDCASEDPVEPPEEVFLNALVWMVWEEQFLGAH